MKTNILIFLLILFPLTEQFTGKVIVVLDGDTIEVLQGEQPIRVRLSEIDCPEKSQAFGTKAKEFTSNLCFGKVVKVEVTDTDQYGRSIGKVTLPDGRVLNSELVRAGLAWHYKRYSSDEKLAALESEAREKKLGLWHDASPTPPWEYRKEKKKN